MQAELYLGIDISSETFNVCLTDTEGKPLNETASRVFANTGAGYTELLSFLRDNRAEHATSHAVMEATGVYWEALALFLSEQTMMISVVNPLQIKRFAQTLLQRNKTDSLDATLIARFGATMKPKLWQPPQVAAEELQIIMHQRDAYVGMCTQERNRLHALKRRPRCPKNILAMSQQMIDTVKTSIADLDADIKERLQQTPEWHQAYGLITSVVGVGIITAGIILAETQCFNDIQSPEQFVAFAGLAPVLFASGTSVRRSPHISPLCCHRLRSALYLAAVSAIRSDKAPFRAFYQKLRSNGKPPKVALIAVARKIARIIAAVMRTQIPFQNNYVRPMQQTP